MIGRILNRILRGEGDVMVVLKTCFQILESLRFSGIVNATERYDFRYH